MARRNIFQPPPPPAPASDPASSSRFPNTGAMSGMKSTLRDMASNAVREIDPALIEDDGPKDRLAFGPEAVADLAESIRQHGQQVPIMVRPLRDQPGRFQVVYGRRRLAALRSLGQPARAMVRMLDDTQAILAQGQENSVRLDPSFIEKALFVTELADSGHAQEVILEALAIDKPMLSRMQKVSRSLPHPLIHRIGPAHGVGRRRWEELADLARSAEVDFESVETRLEEELIRLNSDDRFNRVAEEAARSRSSEKPDTPGVLPQSQVINTPEGKPLAEIKASARHLTLKLDCKANPQFTSWLQENAAEQLLALYSTWSDQQR